ncbi:MAG TPA: PadR family transcriptional regulator [Polyangiaceae bacterium]|jgi:DNA-binding PadR family transcriptional regulator|nr:PadR family transcriptional regulator [Polyangiaceae bacterium]
MDSHAFFRFWGGRGGPDVHAGARRGGRHDHRGGPFGGNPFGGNPFGDNPFGGNPFASFFRRGGRARRGDVRAAILALLAEEPRNGYQLMQEIEQRSQGAWRPSPGSVYPALQQLEDEGLVKVEVNAAGKTFHLTDTGRERAKELGEEAAPWEVHNEDERVPVHEFARLAKQVVVAAVQVASVGTPAQVAEARKILTEARRALYSLLARDDEDEE